ncbi:MAG: tyrosine-type recombinase/integrase [Candidatus Pacearchaeota archaeon]|nr:tyrosine-type recombinase/integrase [Candidatus Pacearchaeota archaeon]
MKKYNLHAVKKIYLEYLKSLRRYNSAGTAKYTIELFFKYLKEIQGKYDIRDVRRDDIYAFAEYLNSYKGRFTKKELARSSKEKIFSFIKVVFKYFYTREYILENVFEGINISFTGITGLRVCFTKEDMEIFLDNIDIWKDNGLRDKAIFELMYSSGLRISEAVNLELSDIDLENRMVLIRNGKWNKDRIVPVTKAACKFLSLYLKERDTKSDELFVYSKGKLSTNKVSGWFKKYLAESGLKDKGYTLHSIRHSTATHLLEGGAGIRYVQELLGHKELKSTIKYTHILLESMKSVYKSYHPRENEFYREVDEEYMERLNKLKKRCEKLKKNKKKFENE